MIIGIDASRANKTIRTGTEWYSYFLIKKFAEIDRENFYVLYTKDKLMEDFFNPPTADFRSGSSSLPENFRHKKLSWPFQHLWTQCRLSLAMLHHKIDVLFVPSHTIPLMHPKRTVTTCHDVGFERYGELYSDKEISYHRFSMRLAVKKASKIIAVSQFTKNELRDIYKVPEDKISVVYNSYDENNFYPLAGRELEGMNKVLTQYNLVENGTVIPYILYVGRLESKKNTVNLLKAFKILKNANGFRLPHKLVLAGVQGTGFEYVQRELNQFGMYKREVIMTGWTPQESLKYLYNGASCFVFPSFYEGFGIPLLESFACGIPVCASHRASLPEIGGEAAIYFEPNEPEDIAYKIYLLCMDKNLRQTCIQRGFERVKDFSWDTSARETLQILGGC